LTETGVVAHIHPLFSRVLRQHQGTVYLANHSLGRPLDQTAADVERALGYWYKRLDGAWEAWLSEIATFRSHMAQLIHAPRADCIVPKTSAGQGLRTVLNLYDEKRSVVATRGEFNSIDHILKVYALRGRVNVTWVEPREHGLYHGEDILKAVDETTALVVVSMVLFTTGQLLVELPALIREARARGARVLVDLYHAAGIVPVNIEALDADFAIGGCYKYLRGGPGACWLYLHPRHLNGSLLPLDTGWFATPEPFAFDRPEVPRFASGGDAFLESTPAILPFYQARAGLEFTLAMGVPRLRAYALTQQALLTEVLHKHGIPVMGQPLNRGAFLAIPHPQAEAVVAKLKSHQVIADARAGLIRLCPDVLNTGEELLSAAELLARAWTDN
jgi:kynureninase